MDEAPSIDPIAVVRQCFQAYVEGDRAAIEALLDTGFSFTSPRDNGLDRETYLARCWPNHADILGFDIVNVVASGERVFVTYEARTDAKRFRNTEVLTIRAGRLRAVEVYFGWPLPHEAQPGGFIDPP